MIDMGDDAEVPNMLHKRVGGFRRLYQRLDPGAKLHDFSGADAPKF
jgi:hypothetical protein